MSGFSYGPDIFCTEIRPVQKIGTRGVFCTTLRNTATLAGGNGWCMTQMDYFLQALAATSLGLVTPKGG
jgi:hypothetical protein